MPWETAFLAGAVGFCPTVSAFGLDRLTWISDVPLDSLVELRRNNENENFKKSLRAAIADLHDAEIEDTDRVAGEFCREIDFAIADHTRLMHDTARKNAQANMKWMGSAVVFGLAALVPTLTLSRRGGPTSFGK